jgi:5-methylcytosine-specific restriction endonuclease McrA
VKERDRQRNSKPERKLAQSISNRLWREAHKDEQVLYMRAWHDANPGRAQEYARKRRALILEATITEFSLADIRARVSYYGNKCAYCLDGEYEELDHAIPLSKGGSHCLANFRPSCFKCNRSKFNKILYKEWVPKNKVG